MRFSPSSLNSPSLGNHNHDAHFEQTNKWMFICVASQLSVGFLEGFANDIYLANSLDLFSWASVVMFAGGLIGAAVYMTLWPEGLRRDRFISKSNILEAVK